MSDTPTATTTLDGLDLDRLLTLRRQRRAIDAEIAVLVGSTGATTLPTWGPCTRCGHVWTGRSQTPPRHCAGCASAYWDKEPRRKSSGVTKTKRPRGSRKKTVATSLPTVVPDIQAIVGFSDADFEAAIRSALPPPPAMTPPPPFLVRPTPPPRYVPTVEEPQPESVVSLNQYHPDAIDEDDTDESAYLAEENANEDASDAPSEPSPDASAESEARPADPTD